MPAPTLLILPGDGIGPEVMAEVRKVIGWFGANGLPFEVEEDLVGGCAYDAHGVAITDAAMERAQAADAVLLGAVGGPKWDKVALRRAARGRAAAAAQGARALREPSSGQVLRRARRLLLAEARAGRGARHPDRPRADRRRLLRRAGGDHRPRQRPEARGRHPASTTPSRSSASRAVAFEMARRAGEPRLLDGEAQRDEVGRALARGRHRDPRRPTSPTSSSATCSPTPARCSWSARRSSSTSSSPTTCSATCCRTSRRC